MEYRPVRVVISRVAEPSVSFEAFNFTWHHEEWGICSGSLSSHAPLSAGEKIFISSDPGYPIVAVVTKRSYDHKEQTFSYELKDPVSAYFRGRVTYEAGTVDSILGGLATQAGSTYVLSGESLTLNGSVQGEVLWVDLVRTVRFATGKTVVYDRDRYALYGTDGWELDTLDPLEAERYIDHERYANQVILTVDEDWLEPTTETETITETGYGVTRVIAKVGEQVQSIETTGVDFTLEEEWTWDANGNMTSYYYLRQESLEKEECTTTHTVNADDTLIVAEVKTVSKRYTPATDWWPYRKITTTTTCAPADDGFIEVDEVIQKYTYATTPPEWVNAERVIRRGFASSPGIPSSSVAHFYIWAIDVEYGPSGPSTSFFWDMVRTESGGSLQRPSMTKVIKSKKMAVHLSAMSTDEDGVDALGSEVEKKLELVGIGSIETLQTAANNFLRYSARCNVMRVVVPYDSEYKVTNTYEIDGVSRVVTEVQHSQREGVTVLHCENTPYIEEIGAALGADPNNLGNAVVNLLEVKAERLNNVCRATVVSRVDYETYQVSIQGRSHSDVKLAKVDYTANEHFEPGKEVTLVRPTGKGTMWEIITRRHEPATVTSYDILSIMQPKPDLSGVVPFLGRSQYGIQDTVMLYVPDGYPGAYLEVFWGDMKNAATRLKWQGGAWLVEEDDYGTTTDLHGGIWHTLRPPKDPETYRTQQVNGGIQLSDSDGWKGTVKPFSYTILIPHVSHFTWTEGTPYAGDKSVDSPTALVKDVTFKICYNALGALCAVNGPVFEFSSDDVSYSLTPGKNSQYFRLIGTTDSIAMTGKYVWQFSEDGLTDWHSAITLEDRYRRIGNGIEWFAPQLLRDAVFKAAEFDLFDGMGLNSTHSMLDETLDEGGNMTVVRTYRLGIWNDQRPLHKGPAEYGESATFKPRIALAINEYDWWDGEGMA